MNVNEYSEGSAPKLARNSHRGRPPKSIDKVRAHRVVTFVTRGELSELRMLSDVEGLSLSATCYRLIRDSLAENKATNKITSLEN